MEEVEDLHQKLHRDLQNLGLFITEWSFSPYHKVHGQGKFLKDSFLRKPYPGMVLDLCERFPIDLENSWMIGDQITDQLSFLSFKPFILKEGEIYLGPWDLCFLILKNLSDTFR